MASHDLLSRYGREASRRTGNVLSELMKALGAVLGPAVAAARKALRELDDDEVPAKVRKVAGSSARNLTPPLTKALLRELDENEWFREKVIETWDRDAVADEGVSDAYLRRADGWWMTVAGAAGDAITLDATRRLASEVERTADLEQRLLVEKERVRDAKRRADEAESRVRRAKESDSAALKAAFEKERRNRVSAGRDLEDLQGRTATLHADLRSAQAETGRLLQRYLDVRRDRARVLRRSESGGSDSIPRDAADLARYLDRLADVVDPYRELAATPRPVTSGEEAFALPSGISPDRAVAIEALARSPVPLAVIVDGYNVLGCIDATRMATGAARRNLITMLGRLLRSLGKGRVVVVFDSALSDGRAATRGDSGIEVRFAEGGLIADDVIVAMAEDLGARAIVISDDRDLRERSERHGATGLWSQALVSWFAAPTPG
jgi:hypothetical protein